MTASQQRGPAPRREPGLHACRCSGGPDGVGLRTLLALDDLEGDPLALVEALVAVHLDGRVVDEDVLAAVDGDEAEALLGVEPLHGALCHVCSHVSCVRTIPPLPEGSGYSLFRPSGHVRGTRTARNGTAHEAPEQQIHARLMPGSGGFSLPRMTGHRRPYALSR